MNKPVIADILGAKHGSVLCIYAIDKEGNRYYHTPNPAPLSPDGIKRLLIKITINWQDYDWHPTDALANPIDREELRWVNCEKYSFPYAVTRPTTKEQDRLWELPA